MAETLEIVILARDKASGVFKNVGNVLGGALRVGAVGAGLGLTALGASLTGVIALGMEGERVQAALNSVIKSTGGVAGWSAGEANSLADSLSRVTKFSADTIVEANTLLLTFTKIGEDIMPRATETVLNMATVFGSTESASIQLGKALNDPIAGIGALSEVGVSFTQEQKDMVKAMVEAGDIAGAQAIILDELETEFGGAARAAGDTFGGKLIILRNKLLDVVETIGMAMMPALGGLVDGILDEVLPAVENFGKEIQPVFLGAATLAKIFTDTLASGGGLNEALDNVFATGSYGSGIFKRLFINIGLTKTQAEKIQKAFVDVKDIVNSVLDVFIGFIDNAIRPFVEDHMPALRNVLIAIGATFATIAIAGTILAIGAAIASLFNPLTYLIALVALVTIAWTENWLGIQDIVIPIVEEMAEWLQDKLPIALALLASVLEEELLPIFDDLKDLWDSDLEPLFQDLTNFLAEIIPVAIDLYVKYWTDFLIPTMETLIDFWNDTLKPLLIDLANWFILNLPIAIAWLKDKWENVLLPALEKLGNFWEETLKPALQGIALWLSINLPIAINWLKLQWETVLLPALEKLIEFYEFTLRPIFNHIWNWLFTHIPEAVDEIVRVWEDDLIPGLEKVVTFYNETLSPMFTDVLDWLDTHTTEAIDFMKMRIETVLIPGLKLISDFWTDTLQPALSGLVAIISAGLAIAIGIAKLAIDTIFIPALKGISNFWINTLKPIFDDIVEMFEDTLDDAIGEAETAVDALKTAFNQLKNPIDKVSGAIADVIEQFLSMTSIIPEEWWPGSPTKFELGIRGIASAMREFDQSIYQTGQTFKSSPLLRDQGGIQETINNYNLYVNGSNSRQENLRHDFNTLKVWGEL